MNTTQDMPLFHEFANDDTYESEEDWKRELKRLAYKIQKWLGSAQCVLVFEEDGTPEKERSFFIESSEVLILRPDEITAETLQAAYHWEPKYYLRTTASDEAVESTLLRCLKPESERYGRNDHFDELALHKEFGDYIMVFDWSEHRIAKEKTLLARQTEISALREAETKKPFRRKLWEGVQVIFVILGCLTFILPLIWFVRQSITRLFGRRENSKAEMR